MYPFKLYGYLLYQGLKWQAKLSAETDDRGGGGGGGLTEAIFTLRLRCSDVFGRHFCCFLPEVAPEIDTKERFVQYTFRTAAKKSFLFPVTRGSQLLKTSKFFFKRGYQRPAEPF